MPWYTRLFSGRRSLDAIFDSPDFYPAELMLSHRPPSIAFVEAGLDIYRRSSFLDHRMQQKPRAKKILCGIPEVRDHYQNAPPGRVGFIFHIAYCCSTLLARYLELLPGAFVLKEPFIITQLAEMNRERGHAEAAADLRDLARVCVQLLAREYNPSGTVIAKLADQCNALGGTLMASSGMGKSVFLGLELRLFLLACLKTGERRTWVRRRAAIAAQDVAPSPLAQMHPETMDDGHAAAYLWLTNGVLLQKLLHDARRENVLIIDGEAICEQPEAKLREIASWFGLQPSESDLRTALDDQTAGRYSKDPAKTFTREDRRAEFAAIYAKLGNEAEAAMTWASRLAPDLGLDPSSGGMLAGLADQLP